MNIAKFAGQNMIKTVAEASNIANLPQSGCAKAASRARW